MKQSLLALGVISLAMLTGCVKDVKETSQPTESADQMFKSDATAAYVPNEVLVKFKESTSQTGKRSILAKIDGTIEEQVVTDVMKANGDQDGFYVVKTSLETKQAIGQLMKNSEVEYAEPNWIYKIDATTADDDYFKNNQLWGMYSTNSPSNTTDPTNTFGSQANTAWAAGHTGSNNVYVGVIDEGAMYSHTDLAANFWTNPFDAVNGSDDDGNGYIDDVHGWDFDGNNNSTFDGTSDDHGTHVSGTIGAVGNNGTGVAGVNWHVTLISAKFLGRRGGTTANAIKAVDYITDLKTRHGLPIVATNNSWGGGGFSQGLKNAITAAGNAGILFIAAAGNDGNNIDATPSYPASYALPNMIVVAAIDKTGALASWSNYGASSVDIAAPGVGIYSTLPGGSGKTITSSYGSYSGTSMATPHVTGAAALYKSTHPNATAADVKTAIITNGTNTSSVATKTSSGKRLNVSSF